MKANNDVDDEDNHQSKQMHPDDKEDLNREEQNIRQNILNDPNIKTDNYLLLQEKDFDAMAKDIQELEQYQDVSDELYKIEIEQYIKYLKENFEIETENRIKLEETRKKLQLELTKMKEDFEKESK